MKACSLLIPALAQPTDDGDGDGDGDGASLGFPGEAPADGGDQEREALPPPGSCSKNFLRSGAEALVIFPERERLGKLRISRLLGWQAEKELQRSKSQILSAKLSKLRCAERRCLLLERRRAEVRFQVLAMTAEIEAIEARYQSSADLFRWSALSQFVLYLSNFLLNFRVDCGLFMVGSGS